ncbi:MAG: 50S ribosomal protein L11 methyltransferase [Deltaproteobacteria bacterium]|nr:50S ribosomal protein L11 methyltransferase [Deltaproteobacteria bacterium]
MRRWLEVSIEVPPAAADALSLRLVERGAPGVIEEGAGERVRLRAHFAAEAESGALGEEIGGWLRQLEEFFPGCAAASPAIARIDEEDWAEGWKQGFAPLDVGARLRVRPPWSAPDAGGRLDVVIEPAMAFGTGRHASTLGCLLAIEEIAGTGEPAPAVLDVGTGSGILAIAAARLGAGAVTAIDLDPVAIEAARRNVARNGLADVVTLRVGSLEAVNGRFEWIVANLYSGLLRASMGGFAERAAARGWLVAAGLLDADRDAVVAAAGTSGWREHARRSIDGWTTLAFRREA